MDDKDIYCLILSNQVAIIQSLDLLLSKLYPPGEGREKFLASLQGHSATSMAALEELSKS